MMTSKNQSLACELLRAANLASLVKSNHQVAYIMLYALLLVENILPSYRGHF